MLTKNNLISYCSCIFHRLTADHKEWIKDLVEKGYRKRAIAAEAARNYFGQELSRSVIMDPETLKRVLLVLNVSDAKGTIDVPVSTPATSTVIHHNRNSRMIVPCNTIRGGFFEFSDLYLRSPNTI